MSADLTGERGSVTAEFAVVLPAVLLVLILAVGSIMIATQKLVLNSAAAEVARHEARGDSASAGAVLGALGQAPTVSRSSVGPLHCVTLSKNPGRGMLSAITVSGRGCAAVSTSGL